MERFRLLLDYANDAVFIFEYPSGDLVDCNSQARRYVNHREGVECHANFADLVPNEAWAEVQRQLTDFNDDTVKTQPIESRFIGRGSNIPVEITVGLAEMEDADYAVAVMRDITERRLQEQRLRESEEKYRTLVETAGDGICIVQDEKIAYANPKVAELLGYSLDELLGVHFGEVVHRDHFNRLMQLYQRYIDGKNEKGVIEVNFVTRDGSYRPVELTGSAVSFAGNPASLVVIRDISMRRKTEERLRESQKQFRLIAENVSDVIWVLDMDFQTFTFLSPSAERMYGMSTAELTGEPMLDRLTPASQAVVQQVIAEEMTLFENGTVDSYRTRTMELEQHRRDGSTFWTEVHASFLRDDNDRPIGILGVTRDISERKRLQDEQQKLISLVERSSDLIGVYTLDGRMIYVNESGRKMIGLEPDEDLADKNYVHLMDQRQQTRLYSEIIPAIKNQGFWRGEGTLVHMQTGEPVHVDIHTFTIFSQSTGEPAYFATVMRDISELKQSERALTFRLEILQIIADISTRFINLESGQIDSEINQALQRLGRFAGVDQCFYYVIGPDGKTAYKTHHWLHNTPVSPAHTMRTIDTEKFPWLLVHLNRFEPIFLSSIDDLPAEAVAEREFMTASGLRSIVFVPIALGGRLAGVLGMDCVGDNHAWTPEYASMLATMGVILASVLAHQKKEIALAKSRAQFTAFMDHLPAGVFIKDENGQMEYVNEYLKQNYDAGRWLGLSTDAFFTENIARKMIDQDERAIREGVVSDTYELTDIRGDKRHVQIYKFAIPGMGKTPLVGGIGLDITKLAQAEEEKDRIGEQLRQAQKMESIGRLAGGIAHDFNNILTGILGYADYLLVVTEGQTELAGDLMEIKHAAEHAAELTQQLLAFSRKQMISPKTISLNDLINNSKRMLERIIGEDVRFYAQLDVKLHPIKADPSQINQVLVNLAVNARDAMSEGGKLIFKTANVHFDETACRWNTEATPGYFTLLSVTDTGHGIDQEILNKIFEPFFTTKKKDQGTGLGLATVYGIVKQNGGFITVHSQPNEGTTFNVYFPAVLNEAASEDKSSKKSELSHGTETILLAEDEKIVRELVRKVLTKCGYQVIVAGDGLEAYRLYKQKQNEIDLVLTDVIMPGMNGRRLYEMIRLFNPKAKVVFMSGYAENTLTSQGVVEPGMKLLPKPFNQFDLLKIIRQTLDGQ
ncbi:MAG TPA: PAS domain S-box protein [bacterium]|nr:PAS domain S-box protein [bacterium]